MPAAAAGLKRMAVQPVGRRESVKCPTVMPGTSVSDPAAGAGACARSEPEPRVTAPPSVHPNSRRVYMAIETAESEILVRPEHAPEVAEHANRVRGLGDFRETVSLKLHRRQPRDEPPPRVFLQEQIAHVHLTDLIAQQREIRIEAAVEEVRLVRIPAGADRGMVP